MEIGCLYSLIIFILLLKPAVQLDLLTPHKKRYEKLLKNAGFLFTQDRIENFPLSPDTNISAECQIDLVDLLDTRNFDKSAQFFDAWSKMPSGLLYGITTSFGNFDECEAAAIPSSDMDELIRGRYTLLKAFLNWKGSNSNETLGIFNFGVCLPHRCDIVDIIEVFSNNFNTVKNFFNLLDKPLTDDDVENYSLEFSIFYNKDNISKNDRIATEMGILVFGFLLTLVILSSFYDFIISKTYGKPNQLLQSFSIFSNCKQLFHIKPRSSMSPKIIECLNGIRSLSLIWNVYGHTYMWSFSRSDTNGPLRITTIKQLYGRLLTSANLSVDSFLLLSGLLIAWIGLHRMSTENGRINIKLMYFHRFLRLTPAYAATILFAAGLFLFVGDGPFWLEQTLPLARNCQNHWWRHLVFIANFFSFDEMCIGHSWFLSVDMQLYMLSPFILIGLWKRPAGTCYILFLMITLSTYIVFISMLNINKSGFAFEELMMGDTSFDSVQFGTLTRAFSWLVGILLGYFLFRQRHRHLRISKFKLTFGWIIALFGFALSVFGPQYFYGNGTEPSPFQSAIYESIGRLCWNLSLSWIIFTCYMGYSELLNSFLSHEFWQIIARLNYSIYIVKTFINITNLGLQKTDEHYSHFSMIAQFWADFGISASLAVLLSLSVEIPFIAIEKYFMKTSWPRL